MSAMKIGQRPAVAHARGVLLRSAGNAISRGRTCRHIAKPFRCWSKYGLSSNRTVPQRLARKLHATDDAVEIQSTAPALHQIEDMDTAATVAHATPDPTPAVAQQVTLQQPAVPPTPPTLRERVMGNRLLAGGVAAGAAFLGGTFLIAVVRVLRKYNSPKERRKRTVDKNKVRMILGMPVRFHPCPL